MKLSHELGKIFESELDKVIRREIDEPEYMPQKDFENCEERARAMVNDAAEAVVKTLGLAICNHREGKHNEDHLSEIDELSEDLSADKVEIAARGWWDG